METTTNPTATVAPAAVPGPVLPYYSGRTEFSVFPLDYTPGDCVRVYLNEADAFDMARTLADADGAAMVRHEATGASYTVSVD